MLRKSIALLTVSASLAASACERPRTETNPSPTSSIATWIGRCGTSTLVLNDAASSEKGGYTRACWAAEETRRAIGAGAVVTIAKGNGWFTDSDRSGCVAGPIVTEVGGQGYFVAAVPTDNGPEVTLFDLPGELPEGLQTETAVLGAQDGRYVNNQSEPVATILPQGSCK